MVQFPRFWRCRAGDENPAGYMIGAQTVHYQLWRGYSLHWVLVYFWMRNNPVALLERLIPSKPLLRDFIKQASNNAWNTASEFHVCPAWGALGDMTEEERHAFADAHFEQSMRAYFGNDVTPFSY